MMYHARIEKRGSPGEMYACHLPCFRVVLIVFPLYFQHSHTHIYNYRSSHLLPLRTTLQCSSWYVGVISTYHRRTIHAPRKKDDSKYYFCVSVCVYDLDGLSLFFYLCDFSGKGEIKSTGLVSFLSDIEKSRCIFCARASLLITIL